MHSSEVLSADPTAHRIAVMNHTGEIDHDGALGARPVALYGSGGFRSGFGVELGFGRAVGSRRGLVVVSR